MGHFSVTVPKPGLNVLQKLVSKSRVHLLEATMHGALRNLRGPSTCAGSVHSTIQGFAVLPDRQQ